MLWSVWHYGLYDIMVHDIRSTSATIMRLLKLKYLWAYDYFNQNWTQLLYIFLWTLSWTVLSLGMAGRILSTTSACCVIAATFHVAYRSTGITSALAWVIYTAMAEYTSELSQKWAIQAVIIMLVYFQNRSMLSLPNSLPFQRDFPSSNVLMTCSLVLNLKHACFVA